MVIVVFLKVDEQYEHVLMKIYFSIKVPWSDKMPREGTNRVPS